VVVAAEAEVVAAEVAAAEAVAGVAVPQQLLQSPEVAAPVQVLHFRPQRLMMVRQR
jgi:hypothetical protein